MFLCGNLENVFALDFGLCFIKHHYKEHKFLILLHLLLSVRFKLLDEFFWQTVKFYASRDSILNLYVLKCKDLSEMPLLALRNSSIFFHCFLTFYKLNTWSSLLLVLYNFFVPSWCFLVLVQTCVIHTLSYWLLAPAVSVFMSSVFPARSIPHLAKTSRMADQTSNFISSQPETLSTFKNMLDLAIDTQFKWRTFCLHSGRGSGP